MKLSVLILSLILSLFPEHEERNPFALTLIGYIKLGNGGFAASDGCGAINLVTPVYSDTRTIPGQLGIGDVLRDVTGTPIDGAGKGYGFAATFGSTATRGVKIGGGGDVGEALGVTICSGQSVVGYYYLSGSNCGANSFSASNTIYNAPLDPQVYTGKPLFITAEGALLASGTYTLGTSTTGPAVYVVTVVGGTVTAVSSICVTEPIVDAGPDLTYSMPATSIPLNGSAFDPNGEITDYTWTQISGPNTATITDADMAMTTITGYVAGTYVFELEVTDDNAETGSDQVSFVVVSEALCATPELFHWDYRDIYDMSGASGEASQRLNDTLGARKWPSIMGAGGVIADHGSANPRAGQFDYDLSTPGTQNDLTTTWMTRASVHPGNTLGSQTYPSYFHLGSGNQRVFILDKRQSMKWDAIYLHHGGTAITNALQIIITNDPLEVGLALFEYDAARFLAKYPTATLSIDYTVSLTAAAYDSVINIRERGRYLIVRINPNDGSNPKQGPDLKNIFGYGCADEASYSYPEIFPDWTTPFVRDTTREVKWHSGRVVATPTGGTDMDETFRYSYLWGGYINTTTTAAANGGNGDTTNIQWVPGPSGSVTDIQFKLYLAMYGDNEIFNPSNKFTHEILAYMAVTNSNRNLLKQLEALAQTSNQHIPIDHLGLDIRLNTSYGRFVWYYTFLKAILGPSVPNPSAAYTAFLDISRVVGEWTGFTGFGSNLKPIMPPFNENNMDFRPGTVPQSSWMPPVAIWAFHDTLFNVHKAVFPNDPFVMQGMAANGWDYIILGEIFGKIWYQDKNYKMCNIFNIHAVHVKHQHDINAGCTGNIGQHSVFAGYRQYGQQIQAYLDTLAIMTGGDFRPVIFTEYSVAASLNYILPGDNGGPSAGCDYNVLSVPPNTNRPTYRPHHFQAYMKLQDQIIYEGIKGMWMSWQYEAFDLTDTISPGPGVEYHNGNDGSQGDYNIAHNWAKAGLWVGQQHNGPHFLLNYRVVRIEFDTLRGHYKALYQHVDGNKKDSFCNVSMNQSLTDAIGLRRHTFPSDVSSIRHMRHNHTDYDGVNVGTALDGDHVDLPLVFEPNYMFFKSPELLAQLNEEDEPDPPTRYKIPHKFKTTQP